MEENQLKVLEQRINNAVTFIENLKNREKALQDEKEQLENRVLSLQRVVEEKDMKIEALRANQLFLKDKIETILDKLEGLAGLESAPEQDSEEEGYLPQEPEQPEREPYAGAEAHAESIIVEENLVDLQDTRPEAGPGVQEQEGSEEQQSERKKGRPAGEQENDLFDNPFIEM